MTAWIPVIVALLGAGAWIVGKWYKNKAANDKRRKEGSQKAKNAHKKRDSGKFTRGMGRMIILFAVLLYGCRGQKEFIVYAFEGTEVVRVYKGDKPGTGDQIETSEDLEFVNWDGWVLQDDVIEEIRLARERGETVVLRLFQPGEHIFFEGDAWIEQKEDRWYMKEGGAFHSDDYLKEVMKTEVKK